MANRWPPRSPSNTPSSTSSSAPSSTSPSSFLSPSLSSFTSPSTSPPTTPSTCLSVLATPSAGDEIHLKADEKVETRDSIVPWREFDVMELDKVDPSCLTQDPNVLPPYNPADDPDAVRGLHESGAILRRTKLQTLDISTIQAFEGMAAATGFSSLSVFTTPNQSWVPEFAVAHGEITTYADGRWGRFEYSRWPQAYARDCLHVACIPRKPPSTSSPSVALWRTLTLQDWKREDCGVVGVGFLAKECLKDIEDEASAAIERFSHCRRDRREWNQVGKCIITWLRLALDRLRILPAPRGVAISLAAHVQRLTFELHGLTVLLTTVLERIESQNDYTSDVLDVVGTHTWDPSVAQVLFRAGVPVWFQQPLTNRLSIYKVVTKTDVPLDFSTTPAYPRLVLAKRDISGVLNTAGEWFRAMHAVVRRQLCGSSLPELSRQEPDGDSRPCKRLREETSHPKEWSSSLGPPAPAIVLRHPQDANVLGHSIRPAMTAPSHPLSRRNKKPARRSRRSHDKQAVLLSPLTTATGTPPETTRDVRVFTMNPFRQFYPSRSVFVAAAWSGALSSAGPLSQPAQSATFYYPPPWLLDSLIGYDNNPDKIARHLHHLAAIRTFCRLRLFDHTVAGRPLTSAEWRDALFGDYDVDRLQDDVASTSASSSMSTSTSAPPSARMAFRHKLRQNLRRLFGGVASLRSYDAASVPRFAGHVVTYQTALKDKEIQRRLVWEAHEINWRCELLSLDALIVGSKDWPEMIRWIHESDISRVWGASSSGMDVAPRTDGGMQPFCWMSPGEEGWEACRGHLQAFLNVLSRWPGCPADLHHNPEVALHCTAVEYSQLMDRAVTFYVRTFISKYQRLPIPPARVESLPST
ncbi:hypothetical protein TRAPUB_5531 [Trametes pubescens]|uniref:Uncharacterized protein n=1 Tax=Trametes pubescens TaxID=154538 RepID=A0A1M2V869_TRAPU|nr:hypothetical protein TRAPUB_5531 [Trametes pubescens]